MLILIIIVILVIVIFTMYNNLVRVRNRVKQAESGIDVYLNQRFDLIPNLVECVKGYSKHEKDIFTEITKLRTAYMEETKDIKSAENLNNKMNELIAVAENYPEFTFIFPSNLANNDICLTNLHRIKLLKNSCIAKFG